MQFFTKVCHFSAILKDFPHTLTRKQRILCYGAQQQSPPDVISRGRYLLLIFNKLHLFYTLEQLLLFFEILNEVQFHWG